MTACIARINRWHERFRCGYRTPHMKPSNATPSSATTRRSPRQRDEPLPRHRQGRTRICHCASTSCARAACRRQVHPEEMDRADRLATQWASVWLTGGADNESDRLDPGGPRRTSGHCDIAAKLSNAGLTPADAELRLFCGRQNLSRDTIITLIIKGHLSAKDAVHQLQEFRRSERPTGS